MSYSRVVIEFKRIQTYLFAVPKLRTVLGANALMGEMLRLTLPELATGKVRQSKDVDDFRFPSSDDDPLRPAGGQAACNWTADDPAAGYRYGIPTRDGGHFQALFDDPGKALTFADEARKKIEDELPGLMVDIKMENWLPHPNDATLTAGWKQAPEGVRASLLAVDDTLGKPVCQWSGQGVADKRIEFRKEEFLVSSVVKKQWDAGTRFGKNDTNDIVGLLQRACQNDGTPVLPCRAAEWKDAEDLEELAGGPGRYLAVVHVDGNRVGSRKPDPDRQRRADGETGDDAFRRWLASEAKIEAFFYSMRSNVRAALAQALHATFGGLSARDASVRPYQLLMVGGDDVLLLTQAEYALQFVAHYAQALSDDRRKLSDGATLDIGAGVVIAQASFPFHTMHALAEELANSAKRLARGNDNANRSVVDWMIVTQSAALDVAAHRRLHDIVSYRVDDVSERLVLSARPYFVRQPCPLAGASPESLSSLQALLDASDALRKQSDAVARSQRKALPERIGLGRRSAIAAFAGLPEAMRTLISAQGGYKDCNPWTEVAATSIDGKITEKTYLTRLLDLLEVAEIPDLGVAGRQRQGSPTTPTEALS
jgi:hypothetical protein